MCLKDGCFLYLGQALPSAYLLPPLYRFWYAYCHWFWYCGNPLLLLWYCIGPVLITATPAVPVYATLEPANLLARRFAFSASSARLDKSTPKRNSFEVSFAYCWVVQMTR